MGRTKGAKSDIFLFFFELTVGYRVFQILSVRAKFGFPASIFFFKRAKPNEIISLETKSKNYFEEQGASVL